MAEEKPKTVTLIHPDADKPAEVPADLVDAYMHGGWSPADSKSTTK